MSGTIAQLKEIKELLDGGVLTQQEFDAQKTLILEKPKITQVAPAPVVGQPAQPAMMQPDQFLQAAGAGRLDEVNQYLEGGGDVNERDEVRAAEKPQLASAPLFPPLYAPRHSRYISPLSHPIYLPTGCRTRDTHRRDRFARAAGRE